MRVKKKREAIKGAQGCKVRNNSGRGTQAVPGTVTQTMVAPFFSTKSYIFLKLPNTDSGLNVGSAKRPRSFVPPTKKKRSEGEDGC